MSKPAFQPLANLGGSNFCFINAIIQNLWNIKPFKDALINSTIPHMSTNGTPQCTCVYCSLKELMTVYNNQTSLVTLNASNLRNALAVYYNTRANDMEDSYEVFQDILEFIHMISESCDGNVNNQNNSHCISHSYFGFNMCEKSICTVCGEENGQASSRFFYQVNVEQLFSGMEYYKTMHLSQEDYLSNLLLFSMKTDYPRCLLSHNCPGTFCKCDVLSSYPLYLTMSFIYATDQMPKERLRPLYEALVLPLRGDLLTRDFSQYNSRRYNYFISGMILYYGQHYVAMCMYEFDGKFYWMECNDIKFRYFSDNASMIDHCIKSGYQPVLLFYQLDTSGPNNGASMNIYGNNPVPAPLPVVPDAYPQQQSFPPVPSPLPVAPNAYPPQQQSFPNYSQQAQVPPVPAPLPVAPNAYPPQQQLPPAPAPLPVAPTNYPPKEQSAYPPQPYPPVPSPLPKAPDSYPPQQPAYPPKEQPYPPQQPAYPPKDSPYPPQQPAYPPKDSPYPPQQPAYPPKDSPYPPQQPAYPPKDSPYPPQQPAYPPQQPAYPPQQSAYPPKEQPSYPSKEQPSYPPQQPSYPPQQPSYPPQDSSFPPQQPSYPPQQPSYPPKEQPYPPQQPAYPPKEQPPYPPQQPAYPPKEQPPYPPQQPAYPPKDSPYPPQQPTYPPQQPTYPPQQPTYPSQYTIGKIPPPVANGALNPYAQNPYNQPY